MKAPMDEVDVVATPVPVRACVCARTCVCVCTHGVKRGTCTTFHAHSKGLQQQYLTRHAN